MRISCCLCITEHTEWTANFSYNPRICSKIHSVLHNSTNLSQVASMIIDILTAHYTHISP